MTVNSPALYMLTPINDSWVFEIGAVYDSISGASPYYHTTLSGASGQGIEDKRAAGDITVTKYFGRTAISVRGAYSTEDDYRSIAGGVRCAMRRRIRTRLLRLALATRPTKSFRRTVRLSRARRTRLMASWASHRF